MSLFNYTNRKGSTTIIYLGTMCNSCCGVRQDYTEYFDENYPKLLCGYSFPLSDRICTCNGIYVRHIREHRNRSYPLLINAPVISSIQTNIGDLAGDWIENPKEMARRLYRRDKRRRRLRKGRIAPHSGSDNEDGIKVIMASCAKGYLLYKDFSFSSFLVILLDILREFIPIEVLKWLKTTFEEFLPESEFTLANISEYFELAFSNWTLFTNHTLFPAFSEIVNIFAVAVMCPSELFEKISHVRRDLTRYISSYRTNATDILDWILKTFTSLVTTLKLCSEKGVIDAFCMRTPDQIMSDIYNACSALYPAALNGSLDGSDVDFHAAVESAVKQLGEMRHSLRSFDVKTCQTYVDRLKALDVEISSRDSGECQRVQPFAIAITGGTGVGKSNIVTPLMQHLLRVNGFVVTDSSIAAVNPRLKHWDNVNNTTIGYKFDDPDFLLEGSNPVDYLTPIGRVLNNEQYVLEKADLAEKGKVFCNCKVAALTSNDSEFGVYNLAKEPAAIHRRFQSHISISVKPEYAKILPDGIASTEMDPVKVARDFPDSVFPDIFKITVYNVQVKGGGSSKYKHDLYTTTSNHINDQYCFAPVQWQGKMLIDIGIKVLIRFLTHSSTAWFKLQANLLARKKASLEVPIECHECMSPVGCWCDKPIDAPSVATYVPPSTNDVPTAPQVVIDTTPLAASPTALSTAAPTAVDDPIVMGRRPRGLTPGAHRCDKCRSFRASTSIWAYKIDDVVRNICISCLKWTRVTCKPCLNKHFTEVGMKNPPKQVIICTEFCKSCTVAPESGFEFDLMSDSSVGDQVIGALKHYAVGRSAESVYGTHLKELLSTYFQTGEANVLSLFNSLDSAFSTESAFFLNKLVRLFFDFLRRYGLDSIGMWIPQHVENTELGAYLHTRTPLVRKIGRLDKVTCAIPLVLYGFGMPITSGLTGAYCIYSRGHPISNNLELIWKWWSPYHLRVKKASKKLLLYTCYAFAAAVVCGASYKCQAFLPASCFAFSMYMHSSYRIGATVSNIYYDVKKVHPIPIRDEILPELVKAIAVQRCMSSLYGAICGIRLQCGIKPQSGSNISIKDMSSLDGMSRYWYKKAWHDSNLDPLPVNTHCIPSELRNIVCQNILHVVNVTAGKSCDAFAITSKKIVIPHHLISRGRAHYKFTRKNSIDGLCGNATFKAQFSLSDVKYLGGDLVVVDIPKSGDFRDMSKYFLTNLSRVPNHGIMLYRDKDGVIQANPVRDLVPDVVTNNHVVDGKVVAFNGISYTSPGVGPTRCMSVVMSVENPSVILGFHLGGAPGGDLGVASIHTADEIKLFQKAHIANPSVAVVPESGTFRQQQYGVNCVIQGVHPNSIAAHMPDGEYRLLGSTGLVSKDVEDIIQTPISENVRTILGCETVWGPPKLKGSQAEVDRKEKWLAMLSKNTSTAEMIPLNLLDDAVNDFLAGCSDHIAKHPPEITRPLDDDQVVKGIPGVKFVESMDPNTSIGFPLGGPKRKYMQQVYSNGVWTNEFTTDMFDKSARKCEMEYIEGRRTYPVFKTFSKIEPTDITRDKVRMVNGAPIDMQLSMRKYVLPILKYMSDHPDFFECSVGVNPYGREWASKYHRLKNFGGASRIIALDHKDYDLKMTSQLVAAAFNIIVRMAEMFGYTESEISIIRGLAADTMWPLICVNGDIIMLVGSTVSGHNATVYINCLINSLMMRVSFFKLYPGGCTGWIVSNPHTFRDSVCLYVYGDDLVGSVKSQFPKFNNRTILKSLAEYGFTLTSYDKKEVPNLYDRLLDIEFLKRKFRYDPQLKTVVAPLNEKSIFKRLCCIHRPRAPNSIETILSSNIDSAMAEWFFYGPTIYNDRLKKMRRVVDDIHCPILKSICCGALIKTYEDRLLDWNTLYQ